ncbi:MAG TPA: hypothetical protein VGO61_06970 [Steroidobacteraceae bacterium]|jgi:hypothetical protein|nr:hypothetical protein [Steroidobacteraceae bacterium]
MSLDLSHVGDPQSLRYRFALLTRPDARRAFLREVNGSPRLLELWSMVAPVVDEAEQTAEREHALDCSLTQRLVREMLGEMTDDDCRAYIERNRATAVNSAQPAPTHALDFSLV